MRTFLAIGCLIAAVSTANAAVIVSQSFAEPGYDEAGNTSGTTANNLSWTSDLGQTASSSITFTGSASGFLAGNSDADVLGIAGNVETVGPWSTSFSITPTMDLVVSDLTIVAFAISGGGNHQGATHGIQFTADIDGTTTLGTVEQLEPGGAGSSTFVLDSGAGTQLMSGTTYTINFTASVGPNDPAVQGNNVGLGSITLNGSLVPEPSSALLLLLGLAGAGMRRRR